MTELDGLIATIADIRRRGLSVTDISVSAGLWRAVVLQAAGRAEDLIVTDAIGGVWFDGERVRITGDDDGPSVVFHSLGPSKEARPENLN